MKIKVSDMLLVFSSLALLAEFFSLYRFFFEHVAVVAPSRPLGGRVRRARRTPAKCFVASCARERIENRKTRRLFLMIPFKSDAACGRKVS